jgi:Gpi18-like mannosyltransferase
MRSIIITFLISSVIFFGYYLLFNPFKLQLLYQSWDGPAYVVVAKSFYDPELISKANTVGLPNYYFANYFPLYPVFIKLFSFIGYWRSSLFTTQFFTILFILVMCRLFKIIYPKEKLNWIAIPLIFFPARWFSITHIGSSEPLFLFLVTLFLIFLIKKKYFYSAIFLALAQITRHAAIWFFLGLGAYLFFMWITKKITFSKILKTYFPYLLAPIALIAVNLFFYLRYQDFSFWAANSQKASYFQFIPYQIFNLSVGGVWKESLIFNYLLYLGGVLLLFKEKKYLLAFLFLFNFLPLIFFVQEDLSRIALSGLPLLYLAYHRIITNKTFQLALIILAPAIYLFSFHFLNYNISP